MVNVVKSIREQLRKYSGYLENDVEEFNKKLNLTRENFTDYIDRQINYLINIKKEYNEEFDYLDEENRKTSENNRQKFDKLCLAINQNDQQIKIVEKLFQDFQQTFPIRPKVFKSIPEFYFQDIQIKDFIKNKQDENSLSTDSSLSVINEQHHDSNRSSAVIEHSFIPVNDDRQVSPLPTGSIGFSHHKEFASQNNEIDIEPQSRLVSTCSTINGNDRMIDLLFKIPYDHNRTPRLISFNEDENTLLIYSLFDRRLEYLSFHSHKISPINLSFNEPILNLGYSTEYHLFYLSTRQTNRFFLFKLNQQQQIEIKHEVDLIDKKDHFISVHMYENFIFVLYLSSSIVMFGKYDIEKEFFYPPISFDKNLYDAQEKSTYKIIDFAINYSFISFLTQLKVKNDKYKIVIHDYQNMNKLHSFDLIDSGKPLGIISTHKKLKSLMCNNEIELLLFVNDPKSHLIHCCTHEQYLIPIQVNAFGICPLNDGNLSLVASRDVRGLKVQDYLQRNNVYDD